MVMMMMMIRMGAVVGLHSWSLRFASSSMRPMPCLAAVGRRRRRRGRMFFSVITTCRRQKSPAVPCTSNFGSDKKHRVLVISGPTGAGKSRLALELAKRVGGEIISADSVQVYRGLDVGSAKPSVGERQGVPHHLIDILGPSQDYSVGRFFEDARKATQEILERGRVPIVVGGTGLYLRWYIYGKPDVPAATPETAGKARSELMHLQETGQWEAAVDLVAGDGDPRARSLALNDWYRLRRSLEIVRSTGSPPSAFTIPYNSFKKQLDSDLPRHQISDGIRQATNGLEEECNALQGLDYKFICFFLSSPRVGLYRMIDLRCEEMLMGDPGILSEASWLLDMGLLPNTNSATRAIGYRQAMEYLLHCRHIGGQCSPGDFHAFLSEFQKASRNFAKRQVTWFRNEYIYTWLDASRPLQEVLSFICDSYHNLSGNLTVPTSLRMKKDVSGRQESYELKSYCPQNRIFVSEEDCFHILEWIRKTQLT